MYKFQSIDSLTIVRYLTSQLKKVEELLKQREIIAEVSDDLKSWLSDRGHSISYGARPLKRLIQVAVHFRI